MIYPNATRRIKITLSYDGTAYHGWQVQPGLITIQRVVEAIVSQIEGKPVKVAASGRTDAGVHAMAQTAAFSIGNPIPVENLKKAMNRLLPEDIRILEVEEVAPAFHPRFDAKSKIYEYRIWREELCPPFERLYVYHHPFPLDEPAMIAAARLFEGEHDFSAFAAADVKDVLGYSKVRRIYYSVLQRRGPSLIYQVLGSGFLKHMVRNMVGTLIEVGKGNLNSEQVRKLMEQPGGRCGATSPPQGLFLVRVNYQ